MTKTILEVHISNLYQKEISEFLDIIREMKKKAPKTLDEFKVVIT